jgi:hypothetical protein
LSQSRDDPARPDLVALALNQLAVTSELFDNQDAVSGTGRWSAIEVDSKLVDDTGEAQEVPSHDRRLVGPRRQVRAPKEITGP